MDLVLWRHADAEPGYPDSERALTAKGRRQAERMALWLNRHLPDDALVLASPARRAQETARALGRPLRTVDALAPGATAGALLAAVGWPGGGGVVVVAGHQPVLGEAAALILAGDEAPWPVKKAAVWWFASDGGPALLRAVIGPDFA
jgi:phosphohistidine phosphatase